MKLLDLFCGAGGCSVGYARAGFEVVGVDVEPQPSYPHRFKHGNAMEALDLFAIGAFDAIHASPPCQAYSTITGEGRDEHPDLVANTRAMLQEIEAEFGTPWIIENVVGAPLENPIMLCGSSFGLPLRRHRLFECSFDVMAPPCAHGQQEKRFDIYEHGKWRKSAAPAIYGSGGGKAGEHWGEAMGIDWMTRDEMAQAIPPAYTEHIGSYLRAHIEHENRDRTGEALPW